MTKRDLQEYYDIVEEIKHIQRLIKANTPVFGYSSSIVTGMPSSGSFTDREHIESELIGLLEKAEYKMERKKAEIEKYIQEIPRSTTRTILRLRYIDRKDWSSISHKVGYSYSHTRKLHDDYIKSLPD